MPPIASTGSPETCAKCGGSDLWVSYHTSRWASMHGCSYGSFNKADGEHLHRGCRTCGYDWTGPVIRAKKKKAAA